MSQGPQPDDVGIFHTLKQEHQELSDLMKQVAESDDVATRRKLFPEIRKQLIAHSKGEEREFYPILMNQQETKEDTKHALEEHQQVEQMLEQLASTDIESDEWQQRFEQMMGDVEDHVEEEENDLMPAARRYIDEQRAEEVEERYAALKSEVLRQVS